MEKEHEDMTTLKFNFDLDKVSADGLTTDEVLAPIRKYACEKAIAEPEYGLFSLPTDEHSFCRLAGWVIMYFLKNPAPTKYFSSVVSTFDGEIEDCLLAVRK